MSNAVRLDCGCEISTGDHNGITTGLYRACKEDCENVRLFLEMVDEEGKEVTISSIDRYTVTCVTCGKVMDGFSGLDGGVLPEPGSISICIYCANVAVFDRNPDGDMYLRMPTGDERADIGCNDMVQRAVRLIKERIA